MQVNSVQGYRMHLTLTLWLCIVLSFPAFVCAATGSDYLFDHLTLEDGLASQEIVQTFQQSNGFIWFATARGVSRYDGYTFRHFYFSPNSKNHISNNFVTQVLEDKTGNIWLATEDGLNRLNIDGSIDIFKVAEGLPSSWILSIFIDSKDRFWVGTGEGAALYNRADDSFKTVAGERSGSINAIVETADEELLFATEQGLKKLAVGVMTLTPVTSKHAAIKQLNDDYIADMQLLSNGWLAIATEYNGLYLVDFTNDDVRHFTQSMGLSENAVSSILQIDEQQLWLGHNYNGISVLNLASNTVSLIQNRQFDVYSIVSNAIKDIFQDSSGIIWVATDLGVSKLLPQQQGVYFYRSLPGDKGLSGSFVYSSVQYGANSSLVANENGIDLIDSTTREISRHFFNKLQPQQQSKEVWLLVNNQHEVWMASNTGLGLFNKVAQTLHFFNNDIDNEWGLPNQPLYTVLPDPDGGVWITGYNKVGLSLFHPDKGIIRRFLHTDESNYTKEGNFTNETILSSQGEIWMATTDGIFRVNRITGEYQHYKLGASETKNAYIRVSSIREGKPGVFWAATQGMGLVKIQTQVNTSAVEISYYTTEQGLPNNELTTLAIDNNTIWLTTNSELIRFNINSESLQVYKNLFNIKKLKFIMASARLIDKTLFISSSQGLVEIDTNAITLSQYSPAVEVTQLLSYKDNIYQSINKASLTENVSQELAGYDIEFHFAALDYANPKHNRFSYRLLGYEQQWSEPSSTPYAAYHDLFPGHYSFEVKGSNSDGQWSNNIAKLNINISIPYWYYALACLLTLSLLLIWQFIVFRRKQIKYLEKQLHHDMMTNLPNRLDFQQQLASLVAKPNEKFALIVVDLDHLKDANDIYGHKTGDEYIKMAAKRMLASIRKRDYLARLSGDEFVILLNRYKLDEDLYKVVNRVTTSLCEPYQLSGVSVTGSASLGVALFPKDGTNEHELFIHADSAMYEAKKAGKGQAYFFNQVLKEKLAEKIKIKSSLKHALKNNEFELYYQPKINLTSGKIAGLEALIRWHHPEEGIILPDKFITEAETNGSIANIGEWVIDTACQQAAQLHAKGLLTAAVSVNISAKQIYTSDILTIVSKALKRAALPAQMLELEITETLLMDDSDETHLLLLALKELGVTLALDNFGSGYTPLNYLAKSPISTLKIDRSIINLATEQQPSLLVLRNMYSLAHSMGLTVVAEGVETQQQADLLLQYKDDLVQGFLYSRPMPFHSVLKLLAHAQQLQ
jgi:diguanylate cyclase (GGDEF)-like protein